MPLPLLMGAAVEFGELLDMKNDLLLDLEAAKKDLLDDELDEDLKSRDIHRIPELASEAAVLERQIGMMRLRGGNREKSALNFISRAHLLVECDELPMALLSLRWAKRLSVDPDVIAYIDALTIELKDLEAALALELGMIDRNAYAEYQNAAQPTVCSIASPPPMPHEGGEFNNPSLLPGEFPDPIIC